MKAGLGGLRLGPDRTPSKHPALTWAHNGTMMARMCVTPFYKTTGVASTATSDSFPLSSACLDASHLCLSQGPRKRFPNSMETLGCPVSSPGR